MDEGYLTPDGYLPRIVDARIEKLLRSFGGVEITGAKWCGKTWSAMAHARSYETLMEENALDAAQTDPDLVLMGDEPHLVDEWQEVPAIWDASRNHIDHNANRKGELILTGSARPKDEGRIRHSGTGRIARLRMRPMALCESDPACGGVSLSGLFDGEFSPVLKATTVQDVARWCCRGGWPSVIGLDDEFALETPAEYVKSVVDVSVPRQGKNGDIALRLMRALAFNVAQSPTLKTLARDMGNGDSEAAQNTVTDYLELLEKLYIIEGLPGWAPALRSKKRVRTKPKRYFVDPSIPASLIGASPSTLARDTQTLGSLFETLVVRDVRTFISVMPGAANRLGYYRDDKGVEADIIAELSDGRWAAMEVKLSEDRVDQASAEKLLHVASKLTANPRERVAQPTFLAFIVGKGSRAFRRSDGIYVLPISALQQ
jgi:predicted AAA+ superfamily ATPase